MGSRHHKQPRKPFSFEGVVTGLKSRFISVEPVSVPIVSSQLGKVTISLTRIKIRETRRRH